MPPNDYNSVNINPAQLQGFIQSIEALNVAINNLAGMSGGGGSFRTIRDEAELQGEGEIGALEAGTRAERTQALQYRAGSKYKKKAEEALKKLVDARVEQQMEVLKQYGLQNINVSAQLQQRALAQKKGEKTVAARIDDAIVEKFESVLAEEGDSRFSKILTAVEESGIRQLRFGELPMQDILRSAGRLATKYYNYRAGQAAEAGQYDAQGRPVVGRIAGTLGRLGPFLGTAGKFVGAADVVGDLARTYYEKSIGEYRNLTASGQLTGQGTMAGFAAKFTQPLSLWQPFGRIGFGTAQEIVQNAREQGFTGPIAGRMEQGMANVISNLGIQVGQATEFFTQSMREGGMSVGQVTQEMNKFHDATFNLNMNINDYTAQILEATNSLRDMGAGTAAPGLAQQITAALPRAYRSPEGTQFLLGAFEKSRGVLASMVGNGANVLNITDQAHARAAWSAMDTLLAREVQRARDQGYNDPNSIANYLSQTSPFFGGTNVNMLQQYIQRMEHGRGIGAQITLSRSQNILNQRIAAASRKVVRYSQLTGSDLKAKNLVPVYRNPLTGHLTSQAGAGNILAGYRDEGGMGRFHALNEFTTTTGDYYTGRSAITIGGSLEHFGQLHSGPGSMGTFNLAQEQKAKEAFITAVRRSHFLSSSQIQELEQAKPFDVQSTLQRIMQAQSGPKVSVGTQVGTITVELGKQAQGLLTLVKERQTGTANGSIQRNHTGG